MLSARSALVFALALALAPPALAEDKEKKEGDAAAAGADDRWPHEIEGPTAKVVVYQPQIEELKGDVLTGHAAVSVARPPDAEPVFGAIWLKTRLKIDREARTATPYEIDVTQARFPEASEADLKKLEEVVEKSLKEATFVADVDELLAGLAVAERRKGGAQALKTDPPKIVFREAPAILLLVDGPAKWKAGEGGVDRLMNSPFFVARSPSKLYLDVGKDWWSAERLEGPWTPAEAPPPAVAALKAKEPKPMGFDDDAEKDAAPAKRPEIVAALEPTELVVTDGEPKWTPIVGADLAYVTNTDSDVFKDVASQELFLLVSGRWFKSKTTQGPWSYVAADALPAGFAKIPTSSEKANVLASVAGTQAAGEALADAAIPETAAVKRKEAKVKVTYDGEPRWIAVEGTGVEYAENTSFSVFRVKGRYYCCHDAVWFEAGTPQGPWTVCTKVPEEIYTLPPSCPRYHVTYVDVYDSTDEVVYVGYYPGYVGCYVYGPTVIYGTGWWYYGWCGGIYYPCPVTYGMAVRYNPWTGSWGVAVGVRGPYAWGGVAFGRGPYGGGWVAVGVGGGCGFWGGGYGWRYTDVDIDINRDINRDGSVRNRIGDASSLYNRRPERLAASPGAARPGLQRPGAGAAPGGQSARPTRPGARPANDVYADGKGDIYRKTADGWQKRDKGGWDAGARPAAPPERPAPRPEPRPQPRPEPRPQTRPAPSPYLERQSAARDRGAQRVSGYQGYRGGGGGGMRGGGGRGGGRR